LPANRRQVPAYAGMTVLMRGNPGERGGRRAGRQAGRVSI